MAYGGQEDGALAAGVRTKETHNLVIVKGQAGGSQAQRVRCEVHLPAQDSRLELGGAIAPIAEAAEPALQIGEKENRRGRVARELLVQGQVRSLSAEIAEFEDLERA